MGRGEGHNNNNRIYVPYGRNFRGAGARDDGCIGQNTVLGVLD